jgi:hypothetical protein
MRINVEVTKNDFEPALLWLAGHVGGPLAGTDMTISAQPSWLS